jgi:hypothetical protein
MKKFTTDAELIQHLFETRKKSLVLICELLPYVDRDRSPGARKAFLKAFRHIELMAKDARNRRSK